MHALQSTCQRRGIAVHPRRVATWPGGGYVAGHSAEMDTSAISTADPLLTPATLVTSKPPAPAASDVATDAQHLTSLVRAGAYAEALAHKRARSLLGFCDLTSLKAANAARKLVAAPDSGAAGAEAVLAVGAAALCLFAHAKLYCLGFLELFPLPTRKLDSSGHDLSNPAVSRMLSSKSRVSHITSCLNVL